MATTAEAEAGFLEYIDELILKLLAADDEAKLAFDSNKDKLHRIARNDTGHSQMVGQIIHYHQKFNRLPNLKDLGDYVRGLQQNAGLMVELDEIEELFKEESASIFNRLDVLIDQVYEDAKQSSLERRCRS